MAFAMVRFSMTGGPGPLPEPPSPSEPSPPPSASRPHADPARLADLDATAPPGRPSACASPGYPRKKRRPLAQEDRAGINGDGPEARPAARVFAAGPAE